MNNIEQTVIDLQTKLAFQEDTLDQLNEVVSQQDLQIRKLEHKIASFYQEFKQLNQSMSGEVIDTKPPHY
ncbi:SlyX family protein [Marinicellulosiphila megalodicopiae]|uniref:SlyX family protein n=1 Tax=Marinicellulosiphila megalodicopiae TaxID=2724896 RepID=UPI003BAEC013